MARTRPNETRCQGITNPPTPPIHPPRRPSHPSERAPPTRRRLRPCLAIPPTPSRPRHRPQVLCPPSRPRCTLETRRRRPNTTIPRRTTPFPLQEGLIRVTTATIPPRYVVADDARAKLEEMQTSLTEWMPASRALHLRRRATNRRPISLTRSRGLSSTAGPPATSILTPRASGRPPSAFTIVAQALPRPQPKHNVGSACCHAPATVGGGNHPPFAKLHQL